MKRKLTVFVVILMLSCFAASAEKLRSVCTIDEFISAQTTSDFILHGGKFENLILKPTLSRVHGKDTDTFTIEVYDGYGFYVLITPRNSEQIYTLAFLLSTKLEGFEKALQCMSTATLMAAGMQNEVFDLTFSGMKGLGFMGKTNFEVGDTGEYNNEGCTARWEVIDKDGSSVVKLVIVND